MSRMLNNMEIVCGNFYSDSRAMESMLEDAATTLGVSEDCRYSAIPSGHFHYSELVIGVLVARNFHFLCHLTTEYASGLLDVYMDGVEHQQANINQLILKHCQPTSSMMQPINPVVSFQSGSYVSFELPFQKFGNMLDTMGILGNVLQLGQSHPVFIPPHDLDQPEYDVVQVYTEGYIAVHSVRDTLNIDIMSNQELISKTIQEWFPKSRNLRFLPRTMIQDGLA